MITRKCTNTRQSRWCRPFLKVEWQLVLPTVRRAAVKRTPWAEIFRLFSIKLKKKRIFQGLSFRFFPCPYLFSKAALYLVKTCFDESFSRFMIPELYFITIIHFRILQWKFDIHIHQIRLFVQVNLNLLKFSIFCLMK